VEGSTVEGYMLCLTFDLLHCYKKFIHAAGDHHWSRQNTRLVRTGRYQVMFTVPDPDPIKSEVKIKKANFVVSLPEVTSTIFLPLYRRQKFRRASVVAS
jgi:hypothetical protein